MYAENIDSSPLCPQTHSSWITNWTHHQFTDAKQSRIHWEILIPPLSLFCSMIDQWLNQLRILFCQPVSPCITGFNRCVYVFAANPFITMVSITCLWIDVIFGSLLFLRQSEILICHSIADWTFSTNTVPTHSVFIEGESDTGKMLFTKGLTVFFKECLFFFCVTNGWCNVNSKGIWLLHFPLQ